MTYRLTSNAFRALLVVVGILVPVTLVSAASNVSFGSHDVASVFRIEKSQNRNQVHYGIRLDAKCRPESTSPIFVYWHELERGPNVFDALAAHERPAYGIRGQRVQTRGDRSDVHVWLEAVPERAVTIRTERTADGTCRARAMLRIGGKRAVLDAVYVQLRSFFGVRWIELRGKRVSDGALVTQRVDA